MTPRAKYRGCCPIARRRRWQGDASEAWQSHGTRAVGAWGTPVAGGLPRRLKLLAMSTPSHAAPLRGSSQCPHLLDIARPCRGRRLRAKRGDLTAPEPSVLGGRPLKSRPPPFEKGGPRGELGTLSLSEIPLNPPFPKGEASRGIAASPEAPRNVHTFSRRATAWLARSAHSGYCEPLAWQSHSSSGWSGILTGPGGTKHAII